jgi:hypothetical protein
VSEYGSCGEVAETESHRASGGTVDAMRLGLRWLAYRAGHTRAPHQVSEAARGIRRRRPAPHAPCAAESDPGAFESQARTAAGTANAVRVALWSAAHGEPDAQALHYLFQTPDELKLAMASDELCGRCQRNWNTYSRHLSSDENRASNSSTDCG